jgi:hypothetical protein
VQIGSLYLVNLLVTLAAFIGLAAASLTLTEAGIATELTFQPIAVVAAAMVAMSSHFFLAFLPMLIPVIPNEPHKLPKST